MSLVVKSLEAGSLDTWDRYVQEAPAATFFHRSGWKTVLERAFGHRTHFSYAEQNGEIVGILPLAEIRRGLFGHSLSSLPFCVYGGIVADTEAAAAVLRKEACRLADSLKVGALELRNLGFLQKVLK